jgi:putative Mg2+ transporter-C (MgtC) family protein
MISPAEMILRLGLAAVLGSAVGFERERLIWAAGLRTHMLVCVGSCLFMIVSAFGFSDILGEQHVILDPSRIAAQVVSGVGFLGAGSILLRGEVVKGLTTAASIWAVAAVGLAAGSGLYLAAVVTTAMILIILAGVKPLEDYYRSRRSTLKLWLEAPRGAITVGVLSEALGGGAALVQQLVVHPGETPDVDVVTLTLTRVPAKQADALCAKLEKLPGVRGLKRL